MSPWRFYAAAHRGLITPAFVPASTEVYGRDWQPVDASVPLEMSDQRSLLRCASNQVRAAFALCALQTQRELDGVSADDPLDEPRPQLQGRAGGVFCCRTQPRARTAESNLGRTDRIPSRLRMPGDGPYPGRFRAGTVGRCGGNTSVGCRPISTWSCSRPIAWTAWRFRTLPALPRVITRLFRNWIRASLGAADPIIPGYGSGSGRLRQTGPCLVRAGSRLGLDCPA